MQTASAQNTRLFEDRRRYSAECSDSVTARSIFKPPDFNSLAIFVLEFWRSIMSSSGLLRCIIFSWSSLTSECGSLALYQRTCQVQKIDFRLFSLLREGWFAISNGPGRQMPRSPNIPSSCLTTWSLRKMLPKSSFGLSCAHAEPRILDQGCVARVQLIDECDATFEGREIETI